MRSALRFLLAATTALSLASGAVLPSSARACSSSSTTLLLTETHPDLPLDDYVAGHLGLLEPTFARSYLVIAYRALAGMPLDAAEQRSALTVFEDRLGVYLGVEEMSVKRPSASPPEEPSPVQRWVAAREAVLGPSTTPGTAVTRDYARLENCPAGAFITAARTLADRVHRYGADSLEVRRWVFAQDIVFRLCSGESQQIVPPLFGPIDPLSAADRAYQIASSHFYAGDFVDAEARFRAIGADAASPWRPWGRYLAARSLTRRGTLGPDPAALARADVELEAILADASLASMHHAARAYRGFVQARLGRSEDARDLAVRLATTRLGGDLGQAIVDYTWALDADEAPLAAAASDSDRLTAWIGVVQGKEASRFDRAARLYASTGSPVWLVAALMKAQPSDGARLEPLLKAAEALPSSSPAFATASYHRFRLLLDRGPTPALFAAIVKARAQLTAADGRSAINAYTVLALRAAPTLEDFVASAFVVAAGESIDGGPAVSSVKTPPRVADPQGQLHPEAVAALSRALPLSLLERVVRSSALPEPLRARLAATVWARAMLLSRNAMASRLAPLVGKLSPAIDPYVKRAVGAKSEAERRLGLIHLLLSAAELGHAPRAWVSGPVTLEAASTAYGDYGWCAPSPTAPAPTLPSFLTAAERADVEKEQKALAALGGAPAFLAREAVGLAATLPTDPRTPEVLHLAVRGSRYGCRDAETTAASKRAFEVLHRQYPKTHWASETRYYY